MFLTFHLECHIVIIMMVVITLYMSPHFGLIALPLERLPPFAHRVPPTHNPHEMVFFSLHRSTTFNFLQKLWPKREWVKSKEKHHT